MQNEEKHDSLVDWLVAAKAQQLFGWFNVLYWTEMQMKD